MFDEDFHQLCLKVNLAESHVNAVRREFGDAYHEHAKAIEYLFICDALGDAAYINTATELERVALAEFIQVSGRLNAANRAFRVAQKKLWWLLGCSGLMAHSSNVHEFFDVFAEYEKYPCEKHLDQVLSFPVSIDNCDMDTCVEFMRAKRVIFQAP